LERPSRRGASDGGEAGVEQVLAHLVRHGEDGLTTAELSAFFAASLGGPAFANRVPLLLGWLADPARCLAYRDETSRYRPTVLGTRAARHALPLELAAGGAQLIRDLLVCDPSDRFLDSWQKLDHLIALELLRPRTLPGRRFSERFVEQIDAWTETHPEWGSVLYREWIRGAVGASRSVEVLGSLGVAVAGANPEAAARELGYSAVFRAAVLVELGEGRETAEVERQWGLSGLDGIEERWRGEVLWLLAGVAAILDVRTFYYHLREVCSADASRVLRVKRALKQMRAQTFELVADLQFCSPLGAFLRGLRRTTRTANGPRIGAKSIRRLEEAGVRTMADLARLSLADYVAAGVRRGFAEQLRAYVHGREGIGTGNNSSAPE
jgi:ATP-dependent DNA helicase